MCDNVFWNPRTLWVVRHAEREDNVNRLWKNQIKKVGICARDDSPLSLRGIG